MSRTPSNAELRQMILDLCRASVLLRIAERREVISGGASDALADAIDGWLSECESQITPILEQPEAAEAPHQTSNVIDFAPRGGVRAASGEAVTATPAAQLPRAPNLERLAELREQLQAISRAIPKI